LRCPGCGEGKRIFSKNDFFKSKIYQSNISNQKMMKRIKLDEEEKELIRSLERGEWTSVKNPKTYKKRLQDAAPRTVLKDKRMNLRISKRDLDKLKAKALEEGIPYQTLVSSVLHKYVTGKLKESAS
jgi:predicted DNA binding CopG/RHH family protein